MLSLIMSIKEYKYNANWSTNSAPLVDLVNAGFALMNEIKPNSEFGKSVMKNGGETLQKFLNVLSNIFDEFWVDDTMSVNYNLIDDLWFKSREVRGTNEPLGNVTLVPFVEVLIKQVRNRLNRLERATFQSEFTAELTDAVANSLKAFPEPKEKTVHVKSKNPEKDGEYRDVTFFNEPFVDMLKKGVSEGAKAQREHNVQRRQEKVANHKKEKAEGWQKVAKK